MASPVEPRSQRRDPDDSHAKEQLHARRAPPRCANRYAQATSASGAEAGPGDPKRSIKLACSTWPCTDRPRCGKFLVRAVSDPYSIAVARACSEGALESIEQIESVGSVDVIAGPSRCALLSALLNPFVLGYRRAPATTSRRAMDIATPQRPPLSRDRFAPRVQRACAAFRAPHAARAAASQSRRSAILYRSRPPAILPPIARRLPPPALQR